MHTSNMEYTIQQPCSCLVVEWVSNAQNAAFCFWSNSTWHSHNVEAACKITSTLEVLHAVASISCTGSPCRSAPMKYSQWHLSTVLGTRNLMVGARQSCTASWHHPAKWLLCQPTLKRSPPYDMLLLWKSSSGKIKPASQCNLGKN